MISPLFILVCVLGLFTVLLAVHAFLLEKRLRNLFQGKNGKALEEVIELMQQRLNAHNAHAIKLGQDMQNLSIRTEKSVRKISTLRFKPFEDAGSNQSFAIALVDDHGDGVILSSLYTRERMSVFAKPVKKGLSEYELTKEEKKVLEEAIHSL